MHLNCFFGMKKKKKNQERDFTHLANYDWTKQSLPISFKEGDPNSNHVA